MKTLVTVSWAVTTAVDVDIDRMGDPAYQDEVRNKATESAGAALNVKDGMVTDCEDFPDLAE